MCKSCGKTIFLLKSSFPTGSHSQGNVCLPLDSACVSLCPSTANCLRKSAGDSRRLTLTGQGKNVEERVPVFTQHTQFFHKRKIRECKLLPSCKCNNSRKKQARDHARGETFPKGTATILQDALWKSSAPEEKSFIQTLWEAHPRIYFTSSRSNSYTPMGSPPMIKRSFSTRMALASSRAFCGV
jgi:hypothetical protein